MKPVHVSACIAPFLALACGASAPTPELVDARRAYQEVRTSEANTLVPARVVEAEQALERAEQAHEDSPGSFEEKNRAYAARRQAELAAAYFEIEKAERARARAEEAYRARQAELRRSAEHRADVTSRALEQTTATIRTTEQELAEERRARAAAEGREAAAIASLREVAQVKEEARGTVITLDGTLLFLTGKSELLPLARQKLDQVAKSMQDLGEEQSMVVEGHTDSTGSEDANMQLSQARAESVRSYLVSKGVKPERITAVGRGEAQPIATNDTPEGRANNRRVEIVISARQQAPGQQAPRQQAPRQQAPGQQTPSR